MRLIYVLLPAVLLLAFMVAMAFASTSANIQANVTVACPFKIGVNALPSYPLLGMGNINFTINSLDSCSYPTSNGYFSILNAGNGNVLYQKPITASISQTPTEYDYTFNTLAIGNITAIAKVNFSTLNYYNQSERTFEILSPANIIITGFSSQSQIIQDSQMQFFISIENNGQYASGNIILQLSSNGPSNSIITFNAPSLSPFQTENITITSTNSTLDLGQYTANVFASYYFSNSLEHSALKSIGYSVVAQSSQSSGPTSSPVPPPTPSISISPGLSITSAPLYITLLAGTSTVSKMSFLNTGTGNESISMKIPSEYSNLLQASATNVTISPGQSISIDLLFYAPLSATAGTHIIPVNITTKTKSTSSSQTSYVASTVYQSPPSGIMLLDQISISNNSNAADGIVSIQNANSKNLSSTVLQTSIPKSLVRNISSISTYGLPATITSHGTQYVITWNVANLPSDSGAYAYYTIKNITSDALLAQISNAAESASKPSQQSIFKVINVDVPIVYTNSNATVEADIVYTGTSPEQVTFFMGGSSSVVVQNASQSVLALPNQNIVKYFNIRAGVTPVTTILTIYIYSSSSNVSYTLPLVVLQNPSSYPTTTIQQQSQSSPSSPGLSTTQLSIVAIAILSIAVIYISQQSLRKPRYNPERAYKLKRLRDKIDLSE